MQQAVCSSSGTGSTKVNSDWSGHREVKAETMWLSLTNQRKATRRNYVSVRAYIIGYERFNIREKELFKQIGIIVMKENEYKIAVNKLRL